MGRVSGFVAATLLFVGGCAVAQPGPCELHVWPAAGVHSMYFGWFHGSTVDGAAKQREGYPALPEDPLPPAVQLALMTTERAVRLLEMPSSTAVIGHETPLDRRAVSTAVRHSDSTAPCYAEIIVDSIFHEDAALSVRSLRALFRYGRFAEGASPARRYTGWTVTTLAAPTAGATIDAPAAIAALRDAFDADFAKFALNATAFAHP